MKYPSVQAAERVEVKTEAQWLENSNRGWVTGWDGTFQRDVFAELSGRLSRTAPAE